MMGTRTVKPTLSPQKLTPTTFATLLLVKAGVVEATALFLSGWAEANPLAAAQHKP